MVQIAHADTIMCFYLNMLASIEMLDLKKGTRRHIDNVRRVVTVLAYSYIVNGAKFDKMSRFAA